jgi:cytochrome c oxidase subunit II
MRLGATSVITAYYVDAQRPTSISASRRGVCVPLVGIRKRSLSTIASTLALFLAIAAVAAACAGGTSLPPQPGNEEPPGFFPTTPITDAGVATQNLYALTFVIAVIVFVLVEGLLIYITIRFRRRPTDTELPPQVHGSNPLEILWTVVPAITVTVLFIAALITLTEEYEVRAAQPGVVIDVTGFQWQWTFAYEQQGLSLTGSGIQGPLMALPVDEPVRIRLHANDVIHSFYVPQFLYKKDVVPGRVNEFDIIVTQPGTYGGQCAEFCGIGHTDMLFTVQAMSRPEFDAWVIHQQQAQPTQAPAPSGAPSVSVTAVSITAFDPTTLTAPADLPLVFAFQNADPGGQPHNVAIKGANPDGTDWTGLPIANAGQSATYVSPPLSAGTYEFYCSVHPTTMRGTLNVGQ